MGWFSKDDKEQKKPQPAKVAPWKEELPAAFPQGALYFDAIRSNAYENHNMYDNYVEFWVAFKVDRNADKWRVMHYTIFNIDKEDGDFKAEVVSAEDTSFVNAAYMVSTCEYQCKNLGTYKPFDMSPEKYPVDQHPYLKPHFYDIEHFETAAYIEGLVIDENSDPYRRVDGKVFSTATFKRSKLAEAAAINEDPRANEKIKVRIEDGVLSDIFHSVSKPGASLDSYLKVGQSMLHMEAFASCMGAMYLGIQKILDLSPNFDQITSLSAADRSVVLEKAKAFMPRGSFSINELMDEIVPAASAELDKAAEVGVYTEPYRKHLAECDLYGHLLHASQCLQKVKKSMLSARGADMDALVSVQQAVEKAKVRFIDLGGTLDHFDRMQAWVANDNKEVIPPWIVKWLDRWHGERQAAMKRVAERQAGVREINVLPAKVKPPKIGD